MTPDITGGIHGTERWFGRGGSDRDAETAWEEAFEMTLPTPEYNQVDEGRYHRPTDTVLLRSNATLETVLDMTKPKTPQSRALARAVDRQFGTTYSRSSTHQTA